MRPSTRHEPRELPSDPWHAWLEWVTWALTGILAGAVLFLGGYWAGSARADHAGGVQARQLPDWFLPIADAYDRDPLVSPSFDFALLYDARRAAHLDPRRTEADRR